MNEEEDQELFDTDSQFKQQPFGDKCENVPKEFTDLKDFNDE